MADSVRFEIQIDKIDSKRITQGLVVEWANDPTGPVFAMLDELGVRTQLLARRYVRVRTGRLQNTIRKRRVQGASPSVEVLAGLGQYTPYTMWEHDGTIPHRISAVNRKTLRFVDRAGRLRFDKSVRHPGTRGSRFLARAIDEVQL